MKLTSENVMEVCKDVLYKESEVRVVDGKPEYSIEPVIVAGVVNSFGFHPTRLHAHARDVRTMLLELPDSFFISTGGGWSFLNLCMKSDGHMWTDLHRVQEMLACMAIGLGMATWTPDKRQLWSAMPGSVPYFQIDLTKEKISD